MRKYLFTSLVCLAPLLISAQEQFLVYSIKGDITAVVNKKETKISKGDMVAASATVQIPADGAITFICKKTGWFSITEAGDHSLKKFPDSCYNGKNFMLANYTKYLWDQTTRESPDKGRIRKAYFNRIGAMTGPHTNIWVTRSFDTINYSGTGRDFPLSWRAYTEEKHFIFSLYDSGNTFKPFYSTIVQKLQLPFSGFIPQLKQGKTYYWNIAILGEEDDVLRVFNYVSQTSYDAVLTNLKTLEPRFENPAEEAYRLAFMLEASYYYAEAFDYYTKASLLDPANVLYKATLTAFKKDYDIQ